MTSTDTHQAYAPLFDDSELRSLARINAVRDPYGNAFERRLIHDRQFVDLSERYDPIEPANDSKPDPIFGPAEKAALAGVWLCGILFAIAALVA